MRLLKSLTFLMLFSAVACLISCGEKISRPHELPPDGNLGETTYVQLDPPWDAANGYNFSNPHKIIVGWDTYIYVADTDNNRVVRLDAHGTIRGTVNVPHPIGITQDELLRILIVSGQSLEIYKVGVDSTDPDFPMTDAVLVYDGASGKEAELGIDSSYVFTDIADAPGYGKKYYVTAYSPDIDTTGKVLAMANAVAIAQNSDSLYDVKFLVEGDTVPNPVVLYGTGIGSTAHPNGITAFRRNNRDQLLITQDSSYFKSQLLAYINNTYYHLGWYASALTSRPDNSLHASNFFIKPAAATADSSGNIYVVGQGSTTDRQAFKFDSSGKLRMIFGQPGSDDGQLNDPRGIAYDNFANRKTIYIADTGNNRILRFKLSTDLEQ